MTFVQFGDLVTIVIGKHNELSDGGHFLLDAMAASRVAYEERSSGLLAKDREARRGVHQGELRRQLATVGVGRCIVFALESSFRDI